MKKIFAILIVHSFCICIYAQTIKIQNVPIAVKAKFTALYPDVKNAEWEKENSQFEAGFKQNAMEISVLIDATGTLIETETEIAVLSLPQAIANYVVQNFPGKKIKEAAKIVNAAGLVTYEAEVGKDDYIFDSIGNFLRKESDDSDEDEDD